MAGGPFLVGLLIRGPVTYKELAKGLQEIRVGETERSIEMTINWTLSGSIRKTFVSEQ